MSALEEIIGYMEADLRSMIEKVPPVKGIKGNINFPIALCILSYMDFWGTVFLQQGSAKKENLEEYIKQCWPKDRQPSHEVLWEIYRNGLAHQYFAKNALISRSNKSLSNALCRYEDEGDKKVLLDTDTFAKDFLLSLDNLRKIAPHRHLEERLLANIKQAEKKLSHLDSFVGQLPTCDNSELSVYTSGATGPAGPRTFTPSQDQLMEEGIYPKPKGDK